MTPPIVILSPHFDDAVLSCWNVLTGPGEVSVLNVFAAVPEPGTEVGYWDRLGDEHDPVAVVRERIAEDRRALALAGRQPTNLGFLDLQYRMSDQDHDELVEGIRAALPPAATLYAPVAVGGAAGPLAGGLIPAGSPHPDHRAVRAAALTIAAEGHDLVLYADLPHASRAGLPDWVSANGDADVAAEWARTLAGTGIALDAFEPAVHRLDESVFAAKLAAVRTYASQLEALEEMFRDVDDPELLGYEVEWRLRASSSSASAA